MPPDGAKKRQLFGRNVSLLVYCDLRVITEYGVGLDPMPLMQPMVAAFGVVFEGVAATCAISLSELDETGAPTKHRR